MRKKISFILFLSVGLLPCAFLFAEGNKQSESAVSCVLPKAELKSDEAQCSTGNKPASTEPLFSVSSDDLDPSESLNRVSGEYDADYLPKDSTYKSKNHGLSDPLHGRTYEDVSQ